MHKTEYVPSAFHPKALKQIKAGDFSLADADEKLRADKKIVMAKTKAQIKNFKKRGLN
jgi:hypothetical protein